MKAVRFVMVGGFLGAGKTTLLGKLAEHWQGRGERVAVITNDQANNLVDTRTLAARGLRAEEIPGGCFCCRFNALTEAAERLMASHQPDVILAEPVGSCTDLVATVAQPLKRLYPSRYQVAPYIVLLDPERARSILSGKGFGGFSAKVVYIFNKQLEEADAIVISKADQVSAAERHALEALVVRHYSGRSIRFVSARSGEGMAKLIAYLEQKGSFGRNIPAVDYDVYAEGEAELGWLNATADVRSETRFDGDAFLLDVAAAIRDGLARRGAETAHLKMLFTHPGATGMVNLVRGDAAPEVSQPVGGEVREGTLIVNARVHLDPELLWNTVQGCLDEVCTRRRIGWTVAANQHFRPGRPVPTYRFTEAV